MTDYVSESEDRARKAFSEMTNLLHVLALSIETSKIDPKNTWHHCDVPALVRRMRATADEIATILVPGDEVSARGGRRRRGSSRR